MKRCLPTLLLLLSTGLARAQFTFATNRGAITVTGYRGPGGSLTIPATADGLPVTSIARTSFYDLTSVTSVTIPDSVTNIGDYAFGYCYELTSATLGKNLVSVGEYAFSDCWGLTNIIFQGNAPRCPDNAFFDDAATIHYLPGAAGWSATFAGCEALPWNPAAKTNAPAAVAQTNQPAQSPPGPAEKHAPHR